MNTCARFSGTLAVSLCYCTAVFSQSQDQSFYARDICVKVRDGKAQEYQKYLQDVVKLAKVRVDAGTLVSYTVAQAVAPAGRAARCDYHLLSLYTGFPPEAAGPDQTAADMKKAGISMSREAMVAKRDELSYLVNTDIWMYRERVGGMPRKGSYARINYDKVHPGMAAEWASLESNGWKQLAEAAAKEHGTAWRVASLVMPGGANLPYNAMTVDIFPSWAAMGAGIPARALWNKVHPDRDMAAHLNRLAAIRDRPRVDVVRLVEIITK